MAVPTVSRGHDAVKEIDAAGNALNDIARRAHAHQIAGSVLRHVLLHRLNGVVHFPVRLADCETADGVAGQLKLRNFLHVFNAKIGKDRPLVDAEEHLAGVDGVILTVVRGQCLLAALEPAVGSVAGALHIVLR